MKKKFSVNTNLTIGDNTSLHLPPEQQKYSHSLKCFFLKKNSQHPVSEKSCILAVRCDAFSDHRSSTELKGKKVKIVV
jgi:hypothetical protein